MKCGSFLINKIAVIVIIALWMVSDSGISAEEVQSLESIKQSASTYIAKNINQNSGHINKTLITMGQLDKRLRLSQCAGELVVFVPPGSKLQGNTTVGVRCDSPKRWSIYISVKISIFEQALVLINKMKKGEIISEADLHLRDVDISKVRGHSFINITKVVGTKLKRSIKAEQVIDSTFICLVCKGDSVVISSGNKAIQVSMAGTALNDGSKGDKIRVQNNASRLVLDAIITTNTTVNVDI